jgi:glyoxylase-like metal-dependent hydrolase (beta-lactamase superfamily II)
MDAAPAGAKGFFQRAIASVNPNVTAGKLKTFSGDTELVPGIRSQTAYGHTLGHSAYIVESKGERLEVFGDLMHVVAVSSKTPAAPLSLIPTARLRPLHPRPPMPKLRKVVA